MQSSNGKTMNNAMKSWQANAIGDLGGQRKSIIAFSTKGFPATRKPRELKSGSKQGTRSPLCVSQFAFPKHLKNWEQISPIIDTQGNIAESLNFIRTKTKGGVYVWDYFKQVKLINMLYVRNLARLSDFCSLPWLPGNLIVTTILQDYRLNN